MSCSKSMRKDTEQQTQNHAVIILASGLSQRLGQPKQLLQKNGKPLIAEMVRVALTTNPQAIFVVIPNQHNKINYALSEWAAQYSALQIVKNTMPETGMAHSLKLGIEAIAGFKKGIIKRVLIMGVDQVLLDKSHLAALLTGTQIMSTQKVVASCYDNWQASDLTCSQHASDSKNIPKTQNTSKHNIIGLPLVIDYALLSPWQTKLAGDKGLRHLIRELPNNQIATITNEQLSYDIDTPEQLTYARQQGWLDDTP